MGYAAAIKINERKAGTAKGKIAVLHDTGVRVAKQPKEIPALFMD